MDTIQLRKQRMMKEKVAKLLISILIVGSFLSVGYMDHKDIELKQLSIYP